MNSIAMIETKINRENHENSKFYKNFKGVDCEIKPITLDDSTYEEINKSKVNMKRTYRRYLITINTFLHTLILPILKIDGCYSSLLPSYKIPYKKYEVTVYLYAMYLYLSTDDSLRKVANKIKEQFNLTTFSHTTILRSLMNIEKLIDDLKTVVDYDPLIDTGKPNKSPPDPPDDAHTKVKRYITTKRQKKKFVLKEIKLNKKFDRFDNCWKEKYNDLLRILSPLQEWITIQDIQDYCHYLSYIFYDYHRKFLR